MSVAAVEHRGASLAVPEGVESPSAKLVSLYLAAAGPATADELADDLAMQKLSLFSVLGTLEGQGVVECDGDRYELA